GGHWGLREDAATQREGGFFFGNRVGGSRAVGKGPEGRARYLRPGNRGRCSRQERRCRSDQAELSGVPLFDGRRRQTCGGNSGESADIQPRSRDSLRRWACCSGGGSNRKGGEPIFGIGLKAILGLSVLRRFAARRSGFEKRRCSECAEQVSRSETPGRLLAGAFRSWPGVS